MPAAEKHAPLKAYVRKRGGLRLAAHGYLRDQLVDMAVRDFPFDVADDMGPRVLAARLKVKARARYDSIMVMIMIGVIANLISKYIWDWWRKRESHQNLMREWSAIAKAEEA